MTAYAGMHSPVSRWISGRHSTVGNVQIAMWDLGYEWMPTLI